MNTSLIKKFYLFVSSFFIFLIHLPFVFAKIKPLHSIQAGSPEVAAFNKNVLILSGGENPGKLNIKNVYDSLKLNSLGLSRQAYDYAMNGFNYLLLAGKLQNDKIISIIDFSLSSGKKRLFVIDLKNYKILFNTYVAHGRNSGSEYASLFSNDNESLKSSLGFYITQDTYNGNHGYSLRLEGEESGINDNASSRAIVMHSAGYVSEQMAKAKGYIGRSLGCPAISEKMHKPVIEKIKNGSCLFVYSPNNYYLSHSAIIKQAS